MVKALLMLMIISHWHTENWADWNIIFLQWKFTVFVNHCGQFPTWLICGILSSQKGTSDSKIFIVLEKFISSWSSNLCISTIVLISLCFWFVYLYIYEIDNSKLNWTLQYIWPFLTLNSLVFLWLLIFHLSILHVL